jgi:hypothetical protein
MLEQPMLDQLRSNLMRSNVTNQDFTKVET